VTSHRQIITKDLKPESAMLAPQDERLKKLVTAIFDVHQFDDNIDCQICSEQFDCLVELVMSGANLRELLPAVEEHIRCCNDCHEEFEALVAIIRAENPGQSETSTDSQPTSG
jgi:hypothetical protein